MNKDLPGVLARHHVVVRGQGDRSLLFAHGFGCDQSVWRHTLPAFEADHRVISFDYIGAGRSDSNAYDPEKYSTLAGYASDVVDIAQALDLRDAVLVGHSFSGMVGVLASQMAPAHFSHLVMIGPAPRYVNDPPDFLGGFERADIDEMLDLMEQNFQAWAHALAPVAINTPGREDAVAELGNSFCAMDPAIARRWARAVFFSDHRDDLRKMRIPSLVLQCCADAIAPVSVGEYIAANTPGATYRLMQATGHCPHMSHPAEVVAVIQDYLRVQGV
jgi:sigma-B regulation protein RsbQ